MLHIHHDDNGVTIETSEGSYHASKGYQRGHRQKRWYRKPPVAPVRAFARLRLLRRATSKNRSALREMPNGDQYYGFLAENDELNRQTQWRTANTGPEERKPLPPPPAMAREASLPAQRNVPPHRRLLTWGGMYRR